MILDFTIKIFKWKFLVYVQSIAIPTVKTRGFESRVPHTTEHVILLDFDNVLDAVLKEDILPYLQELFSIGDFYVFATSELFKRHSICIDRMPLREAYAVICNADCDGSFVKGARINEFRSWVLRAGPKGKRPIPKYLYTVESPYNGKRLQSQAHAQFLKAWYGVPVRLVNPDGNDALLNFQEYKTFE
jgi:hypothetical protein